MKFTSINSGQKFLAPKNVPCMPNSKKLAFLGLIVVFHLLARIVHAVTTTAVTPYAIASGVTRVE